ncbi:hypothetical protein L1987_66885 [Smallanthus sonchifolius]|uniref:Uncharacterized protein n=1 Tax=Smallanthus sonchifolius TaxID=185202 RepID=A0ACB9BYJ7_9ASTR|nr:hypothetical protein L1987_66885 [Smallanthus sonchifolius]
MESVKANAGKQNFLAKTWKRCRSFPHTRGGRVGGLAKSKSWNGKEKKMTPEGFFPVYVGPDKQRFAVKTKYVNHPLFTMLLEDAEMEYGYNCDGPILLPCDVDLFYKVVAEMEVKPLGRRWSFAYGSCSPFNPSRRLGMNGADQMGKGYGSYEALSPWSLIKMN